jgi:ABC-type nitrate/sulfonate/bicarbonate transport system permease component
MLDRIRPWVIILAVVCGVFIFFSTHHLPDFQLISNLPFLRGFFVYLVQAVIVSVFGGAVGVLLGILIRRSEWLTNSAVRFLRLAMWLPFFVFWALPIWRTRPSAQPDIVGIVDAVTNIVLGALAAGPVITLAACYFYLSSRELQRLEMPVSRFYVTRAVFPLALLFCLLWQLFLVDPWPWAWMNSELMISASWSAVILVAAVAILGNVLFGWSIQKDTNARPYLLWTEFQNSNSQSLIGVLIISALCVAVWQLLAPVLKGNFLIEPPLWVGFAIRDLFVTGDSPALKGETIWLDVYVSLAEIAGGIGLASLFAFLIFEGFVRNSRLKKFHWIVFVICVAPVTLVVPIILAVGIGMLSKALMICSIAVFPCARALWSYTNFPLAYRFLLAIDESLPYAFVGMVFAEAYAATAGLGFLILVAGAQLFIAKAIATALITFGLLVLISSALRFVIKRCVNATTMESVVAPATTDA